MTGTHNRPVTCDSRAVTISAADRDVRWMFRSPRSSPRTTPEDGPRTRQFAPNGIGPEVDFDLGPQVLAEARSAVAAGHPGQNRPDEAVVLAAREVQRLVADANRVPSIQQL